MSEEERDQIVLTPDAESYQTPEWISRLASERRIVREQLDERKGVRVPSEDPDYGYEGEAWPVWAERERDAILQPPKNETLVRLALRSSMGLNEAMRLDALRMVCDESYHGLFSVDMKLQLARAYQVPPAADAPAWFLRRLDQLLADLEASQRGLAKLLFVAVSETLISASLAEHARGDSAPTAVRDMLQDHAVDEGRHHAFFAAFARYLWARLEPGERQWAGRLLPRLIDMFLAVDTAAIQADLVAAALSESDARQVVEETFASDEIARQKRVAAIRTLRYFEELGAFRDSAAQDEIVRYGLAEP